MATNNPVGRFGLMYPHLLTPYAGIAGGINAFNNMSKKSSNSRPAKQVNPANTREQLMRSTATKPSSVPAGSFGISPKVREEHAAHLKKLRDDKKKPPTPDTDVDITPEVRKAPAPSDPNNTGATGVDMKGFVPSMVDSGALDSGVENLMSQYGMVYNNPFATTPLAGTPRGQQQQALIPGQIAPNPNVTVLNQDQSTPKKAITGGQTGANPDTRQNVAVDTWGLKLNLSVPKGAMPVDSNPAVEQQVVSGMERESAPVSSGDYDLGDDAIYASSARSPQSAAFLNQSDSAMGLRASELSQGLMYASGKHWMKNQAGEWTAINDKDAVRSYKDGNMAAQDLLATALKDVPAKAIEKSIATGDPVTATEGDTPDGVGNTAVLLNPFENEGAELGVDTGAMRSGVDAGKAWQGKAEWTQPEEGTALISEGALELDDDMENPFSNTVNNIRKRAKK